MGVNALAQVNDGDGQHFGVKGFASGAIQNVGIYGKCNSNNGTFGAGIEGISGSSSNE